MGDVPAGVPERPTDASEQERSWWVPAAEADARPRRRRRAALVAVVVAAVLVVVATAGFALGRQHSRSAALPGNQGAQGGPFPGYGSGNGGNDDNGGPWSGQDGAGQSGRAGAAATSAQVTGLVRIVSTEGFQQGEGVGTGMVLTPDGEVVTNHHVVAGATGIKVTVVATGTTYAARVVGTDAAADIAVLRLAGATNLATVRTASQPAAVGDTVTAVGDAGGSSDSFTAVRGRVLELDQSITTESSGAADGEHLSGLIEVGADVVPGDSGGPVLNSAGDVVAMDTAASMGSTDVMGYAIPVGSVLDVVRQIDAGQASGAIHLGGSAFLGVELSEGTTRATVAAVIANTPAARAGLQAGDTITAVDSAPTPTAPDLRRRLGTYAPGDTVRLTWSEPGGASRTASVTLASGPVA